MPISFPGEISVPANALASGSEYHTFGRGAFGKSLQIGALPEARNPGLVPQPTEILIGTVLLIRPDQISTACWNAAWAATGTGAIVS